jgi:hypothetical protein
MKHPLLIFCFLLAQSLFAQSDIVFTARPSFIGYYHSVDGKYTGEPTSITSDDISGYMLKIEYKKDSVIRMLLYNSGELLECNYSKAFKDIKINKKYFNVRCNSYQTKGLFHREIVNDMLHPVSIEANIKSKKGMLSYHYPEEQRIYIYFFDLL